MCIRDRLHAHFEDHDKDLYYGQIVGSIIENGRADRFIVRLCELIKHLAVDKLHIVGDLFDRGPRPDIILDLLMRHHNVDIQWGNHDVVWMGAAAGSPICICTVLKTTLAYHNPVSYTHLPIEYTDVTKKYNKAVCDDLGLTVPEG